MDGFIFADENMVASHERNCYIASIGDIGNSQDLIEQLKINLKFPDYFGYNWDALNDCLNDFCWIAQKKIMIIHRKLPKIPETDLSLYIRLLYKSITGWEEWEGGAVHQLVVVFPESSKAEIVKYIEQAKNFYAVVRK